MKKSAIGKRIILIVLMELLFAPLVQNNLSVFNVPPTMGWFPPATDTSFSFKQWWTGDFQKIRERFINENFGFRDDIIRLNNQMDYTLFKKVHEHGIYMGKNNCLFDSGYTATWLGKDFAGAAKLDSLVYKTKYLQDTLSKLGKDLIIVLAANKSYYFQEDMPYRYGKRTLSNYDYLLLKENQAGVNVIDFNGYLRSLKKTTHYPLFPK